MSPRRDPASIAPGVTEDNRTSSNLRRMLGAVPHPPLPLIDADVGGGSQ